MMIEALEEQGSLILAAEDCPQEYFEIFHKFSNYEEKIIRSLIAHGPVLLRGGRGSGKSALLLEADKRLKESNIFSAYLSLRNLPLLRSKGEQYDQIFCELLIDSIRKRLVSATLNIDFSPDPNIGSIQKSLIKLSNELNKRIVLLFDDAAHIGRETALTEFFDIFRTISSASVSCKAAIYPGVTKFGVRFDVYNDATVIDIARDERSPYFNDFFLEVMKARYSKLIDGTKKTRGLSKEEVAKFLGMAVLGNMRAFVFACNWLNEEEKTIGFSELNKCLLHLSSSYYWPLLDELAPKLGVYEALIEPSLNLAEKIFQYVGNSTAATSAIVHREIVQKYAKLFEILEYSGFISRREASRGMKSGGRGTRFSLSLCTLLEKRPGTRLTSELLALWLNENDPAEIHSSSAILDIQLPPLPEEKELTILTLPIDCLKKSKAYPYGLTDSKISVLKEAGFDTVGKLADASDNQLSSLHGIGDKSLLRIRNVLGQAIWM